MTKSGDTSKSSSKIIVNFASYENIIQNYEVLRDGST